MPRWAFIVGMLAAVVLALAVRWPLLTYPCHPDQSAFSGWAYRMTSGGLGAAYGKGGIYREVDGKEVRFGPGEYPAGSLALFYLWGICAVPKVTGMALTPKLAAEVHSLDEPTAATCRAILKTPGVVGDLLAVVLLGAIVGRRFGSVQGIAVALLLAVHPALIFNSCIWGQIDALHSVGMAAMVELLARRRNTAAAFVWALAMLIKFQAVMLLPVVAACFGRDARGRDSITGMAVAKRFAARFAVVALLTALSWTPFLIAGSGRHVLDPYLRAAGRHTRLTFGAFNLAWIENQNLRPGTLDFMDAAYDTESLVPFGGTGYGVTYRHVAVVLLLGSWTLVVRRLLNRPFDGNDVRVAGVLAYATFFTFATQVHERYLFPAVFLLVVAYRPTISWWLLWAFVGVHTFVNQGVYFSSTPCWLDSLLTWPRAHAVAMGNILAWSLVLTTTTAIAAFRFSSHRKDAGNVIAAAK